MNNSDQMIDTDDLHVLDTDFARSEEAGQLRRAEMLYGLVRRDRAPWNKRAPEYQNRWLLAVNQFLGDSRRGMWHGERGTERDLALNREFEDQLKRDGHTPIREEVSVFWFDAEAPTTELIASRNCIPRCRGCIDDVRNARDSLEENADRDPADKERIITLEAQVANLNGRLALAEVMTSSLKRRLTHIEAVMAESRYADGKPTTTITKTTKRPNTKKRR